MSLRLQSELDKLKADGITPADLTASELAALVRACDRCDNPFGAVNAEAAGFPVKVCEGVYLWRLTAGACVWLEEFASRWWPPEAAPRHAALAHIYAMRHAREPEAFAGLTDEATAYRAIRDDMLTCAATEEEIRAALAAFPDDDADAKRAPAIGSPDWRYLAQRLEAGTGIPISEWMWRRPARTLAESDRRLAEFAAAQGGGKAPRMKDELDRAIMALARVTAEIRRNHPKKEAADGR